MVVRCGLKDGRIMSWLSSIFCFVQFTCSWNLSASVCQVPSSNDICVYLLLLYLPSSPKVSNKDYQDYIVNTNTVTSLNLVLFVLNMALLLLYLLTVELSYFGDILAWPMQCFLSEDYRKLVIMFSVVSVQYCILFSVGLQLEHLSFLKFSD